MLDFADFALQEQLEDNLTLYDRMSDISDTTTINQILFSGFLIFSSQTSKVKATPVAILDFVIRSFWASLGAFSRKMCDFFDHQFSREMLKALPLSQVPFSAWHRMKCTIISAKTSIYPHDGVNPDIEGLDAMKTVWKNKATSLPRKQPT